mgnify:FL=1
MSELDDTMFDVQSDGVLLEFSVTAGDVCRWTRTLQELEHLDDPHWQHFNDRSDFDAPKVNEVVEQYDQMLRRFKRYYSVARPGYLASIEEAWAPFIQLAKQWMPAWAHHYIAKPDTYPREEGLDYPVALTLLLPNCAPIYLWPHAGEPIGVDVAGWFGKRWLKPNRRSIAQCRSGGHIFAVAVSLAREAYREACASVPLVDGSDEVLFG